MDAKRCDVCEAYYHGRRSCEANASLEIGQLEDLSSKMPITCHVTFLPQDKSGSARDLCPSCLTHMVRGALGSLAYNKFKTLMVSEEDHSKTLLRIKTLEIENARLVAELEKRRRPSDA